MANNKSSKQTKVKSEETVQDQDPFKLEQLFVDENVTKAEVLIFGKKQTFYFKQLPAVTIQTYSLVESSGSAEEIASQMVKIVQQSLCTADGELVLSMKQALKLKTKALTPLFYKALQVAAGLDFTLDLDGKPKAKEDPASKK